jgi:hypothetical protein
MGVAGTAVGFGVAVGSGVTLGVGAALGLATATGLALGVARGEVVGAELPTADEQPANITTAMDKKTARRPRMEPPDGDKVADTVANVGCRARTWTG